MQRTTIIKSKKIRKKEAFIKLIIENNGLLLIFLFLILGLVFGTLSNKIGFSFNENIFTNYLSLRQNEAFFSIFFNVLLELLPYIAVCFFAGTCMAGSFIVPAVVFYRGYVIGTMLGHLYLTHGLYGIVFNVIIVIPAVCISCMGIILMSREAFLFSLALMKLVFPGKAEGKSLFNDFMLYCKRQLLIVLLFVLASVVDAIFSIAFISFFNF